MLHKNLKFVEYSIGSGSFQSIVHWYVTQVREGRAVCWYSERFSDLAPAEPKMDEHPAPAPEAKMEEHPAPAEPKKDEPKEDASEAPKPSGGDMSHDAPIGYAYSETVS